MSNESIDLEAVNRFAQVAASGHHPAASTGEKIAARLAKALHAIGDDFAILDGELREGAFDLARLMGGPWPTASSKTAIFRLAAHAAGKPA